MYGSESKSALPIQVKSSEAVRDLLVGPHERLADRETSSPGSSRHCRIWTSASDKVALPSPQEDRRGPQVLPGRSYAIGLSSSCSLIDRADPDPGCQPRVDHRRHRYQRDRSERRASRTHFAMSSRATSLTRVAWVDHFDTSQRCRSLAAVLLGVWTYGLLNEDVILEPEGERAKRTKHALQCR